MPKLPDIEPSFNNVDYQLKEVTPEDREVWQILFTRQMELIKNLHSEGLISDRFLAGVDYLGLTDEFPGFLKMDQFLRSFGWQLQTTPVIYMNKYEWFNSFANHVFPTTWYIRTKDELDFTPNPDIFHDRYGHWPFLVTPDYMACVDGFGRAYERALVLSAGDLPRQETYIAALGQLWWFGFGEFTFIHEDGKNKVFAPGLVSSRGELLHSLSPSAELIPFDLLAIIQEPPAKAAFHNRYFVLESVEQLSGVLGDFPHNIDQLLAQNPELDIRHLL